MNIIDKTYNKIQSIECSYRTSSEKRRDIKKELRELYNRGKGYGKITQRTAMNKPPSPAMEKIRERIGELQESLKLK